MPEKKIRTLYNKILPQWKICFFTAVIIGIFTHIYKITNWLPNWDSLVFRYDPQNMLALGRWFLPVICSVSSFYDLPFLNGILAIIFHALGAVLICKAFNVKKGITAGLIGGLIASFPAVTSVMMYNYVADGYAFSFLLISLSFMLLNGEKPRYVLPAILIALSVGIYQAYITVAVLLILLKLIDELIFEKKDLSYLLKKTLKLILTGGAGMLLYYLVMTLLLKITGTELLEYQGLDSAVSLSGIDIWGFLYICKNTFLKYFFDFSAGFSIFSALNSVIILLTVIFYITGLIKNKLYKSPGKLIYLVVCVFLLPVGGCILAFINSSMDYHNLMKMGFFVYYLFFILLYERMDFLKERERLVKSWGVLLLGSVLIFNHIVIANVSFHKLQMAYEKSFGTLIRIADRIEQTENSGECKEILVIGALPGSEAYSAVLPPDITGTTDGYILRADDETVGQSVLCSTLNDYCGKEYDFLAGEEKQRMMKKDAVKKMGFWPEKDSIAVVDGVIVIKLGTESER